MGSNSLTKTNKWSGRNEVTETSGRLHPLWPQNKWLHTPRTADYRHSRQDRWIQTELAFTLAKNATKPNPSEIIPLQTTRKENNWKTEEALVWAAVTVETERIKGSNPWCLSWWYIYILIIKPARHTYFSNLFLEWNSTCFGQFLCPSSGVQHCTHSNGMCHTGLLIACWRDQDDRLLLMDRVTVQNMWSSIPKINLRN